MTKPQPLVAIIMGSDSDWPVMKAAAQVLADFGIAYDARVVSAHRTPDLMFEFAENAAANGFRVIIAGAGGAAANAGQFAASILSQQDQALAGRLKQFRAAQTGKVMSMALPDQP